MRIKSHIKAKEMQMISSILSHTNYQKNSIKIKKVFAHFTHFESLIILSIVDNMMREQTLIGNVLVKLSYGNSY